MIDPSSYGIVRMKEQLQIKSNHNCISQIQFIKNKNILSLDYDGNLYKWEIDLKNKELIKLEYDQNKIFNFQQVNQDQNLLLICNYSIQILNLEFETLNELHHNGENSLVYDCKQFRQSKIYLNKALRKILLAIAQD